MPTLVAMSRSGDVVISRDLGQFWLHLPPTSGGVRMLNESEVDRQVSYGDLTTIDRTFDNYQQLSEAISAEVANYPLPGIDPTTWDETDIADMLAEIESLIADGERHEAKALVVLLAGLPQVRASDELHSQVIARLVQTNPVVPQRFKSKVPPAAAESAYERWSQVAA